jgi:metal-responsive CopG/Arc/MetJ family transcriptional regulator
MSDEMYIKIQIPKHLLDKLSDLAKEYDTDSETLTVIAIKKLLDDVEFIRGLRAGIFDKS